MGLSTAGRPGPGVLGRVLRVGGLAATAAAPLAAMLVFSAGPALAGGGPVPGPLPPDGNGGGKPARRGCCAGGPLSRRRK